MTDMTDIKGIGPAKAETLEEEGYDSVDAVAEADRDELAAVDGVGEERALEFIVEASNLVEEENESEEESAPDESEQDEFDLTPSEVAEELESEDDTDEDTGDEDLVEEFETEEEAAVAEEEMSDEPETFTVRIDFKNRLQYHTFHAAIMRYHENIYTSNQPYADAMQKILDGLESGDGVAYDLTEEELNTLHTAVKQCRTDYQGNNLIDHMDALNPVEDQINDQRRDYLFD